MAMPVDVFHATTKHKATDQFCNQNCNPALFPEIYREDTGNDKRPWIFNSSAAEQINVWFGKFLAVVREMSEVHFNFFLDEMIMIHNAHRHRVLEQRKLNPRLVPLEELQCPRS